MNPYGMVAPGGFLQPGGYMQPGGLSTDAYVDKCLRPLDAEHYSAAGILPYRRSGDSVELLLPREQPWNSFTQGYDPVAWNVFGGKRVPRQEHTAMTTAVRNFRECIGQVEGVPDFEALYDMLRSCFVVWYPLGKFAMLAMEVTGDCMSDFPDRFRALRQATGPSAEFVVLPMGIKKYIKQIEDFAWMPSASLVPQSKEEVTDLLANILQVPAFRDFLEGKLDPATAWPQSAGDADAPEDLRQDLKGKAKGSWGGKAKGGGKGKGQKGWKGPSKGNVMRMYLGKGMPQGPVMYPPVEQNLAEMQRQMYGEQLYVLVQPLSPSPYLAQKITGMLLELPRNELLVNLTNQEELHRRVQEALDVLREDGIVS